MILKEGLSPFTFCLLFVTEKQYPQYYLQYVKHQIYYIFVINSSDNLGRLVHLS